MPETTRSSGRVTWVRAACNSSACVEAAREGDQILVRDSKDPAGPVLHFDTDEFGAFVAAVKTGDFDTLYE